MNTPYPYNLSTEQLTFQVLDAFETIGKMLKAQTIGCRSDADFQLVQVTCSLLAYWVLDGTCPAPTEISRYRRSKGESALLFVQWSRETHVATLSVEYDAKLDDAIPRLVVRRHGDPRDETAIWAQYKHPVSRELEKFFGPDSVEKSS